MVRKFWRKEDFKESKLVIVTCNRNDMKLSIPAEIIDENGLPKKEYQQTMLPDGTYI